VGARQKHAVSAVLSHELLIGDTARTGSGRPLDIAFGFLRRSFAMMYGAPFRCEERIFAKVGYPALAEHAREHDEILEDLAAIPESLNERGGMRPGNAGLSLCNFILCVTMTHGLNSDGDYCTYITDETGKESTACA
jgi:hemerythrin